MPIKLEHTNERLTRRTGLVLVNRFGDTIKLPSHTNRAFPAPGSTRGLPASDYVLTLAEMMIDGAVCLEDVRLFENDDAYSALTERDGYIPAVMLSAIGFDDTVVPMVNVGSGR